MGGMMLGGGLDSMSHWGVPQSTDPRRAKRLLLSNRIAIASTIACLFYCLLYPLLGVPRMTLVMIPILLGWGIIPWLNRAGHIRFSRILYNLVCTLSLLASSLALGTASGIHLFLIPSAWLVLILFDWEERKSMIGSVAVNFFMLLALEVAGPEHGLLCPLDARHERLLHFFVVITAQAMQIAVVLYFFVVNRKTETALADAGETAQSADKAKSQFLANMSHEIRTPLNGILGMSSLLLKSEMRDDQKELVQTVQTSGLDLMAIVSEILDLSKIEAGKMRLDLSPFHLENVLETTLRPFEHEARRKRLRLMMEMAPDLPARLVGDAMRLKQVLNNLIGNALKFTQSGGVVFRIRKGQADSGSGPEICALEFEVEDTGIGIPAQAQDRIFQPFAQSGQAEARRYGGTGLGLFICKQIVEMMGGTIGFRTTPGQSTVFQFTLAFPIATGAEAAEPSRDDDGDESRTSAIAGSRLLIVEDHPLNQKVLSGFLAQFGLKADTSSGGQEALRLFSREPYEVVFMDCHMPGMDGFECTRALREATKTGKRPTIIGVTADAMQGTRQKCLEAGMDDVITKPILTEELQRALTRWLGMAAPSKPQAASAPPRSPWVDVRHLRQMDEWIRAYDPGFWERSQEQFRQSAVRLIGSIREAGREGKSRQAGESAHALKGLCLMMGLSRMGEVCRVLEEAAAKEAVGNWSVHAEELETFLEPSLMEMRKQIGQA